MGWKDRAEDTLNKKGKGEKFTLKQGENYIFILPTKAKKGDHDPYIFQAYKLHANIGPKKQVSTCGKTMDGSGKCWLEDKQLPKLEESDSTAKRKQAEAMISKDMLCLQIAVRESKKIRGPFKFTLNLGGKKSLAWRLVKAIKNPRYNCEDTKRAKAIIIERDGEGLSTSYSAPVIGEDKYEIPKDIIKKMKTFEELIPKYDEARMKNAYLGREEDSSSDSNNSNSNDSSSKGEKKKMAKKASSTNSSNDSSNKSSAASSANSSADDSSNKKSSADSSAADSSAADSSSKKSSAASSSADSSVADSSSKSSAASSAADSDAEEKPKKKGAKGKAKKPAAKGKGKKGKK